MKNLIKAVAGLGTLSAFVLCAIGATGYLLYDGHALFAVAELVVSAFAAKPIVKTFQKLLL